MSQVIAFDDRPSDLPVTERIWRSRSDHGGAFLSVAATDFEMCVTRHQGRTFITLRGPETRATRADCPPDGEWLGIRFRIGTFMPRLTPGEVKHRAAGRRRAAGGQTPLEVSRGTAQLSFLYKTADHR